MNPSGRVAGRFVKRAFDVAAAVVGLVGLSPLLAAIAVLVKVTSTGPALHRAVRVGRDGRQFSLLKFRSMKADAASLGPGITRRNDPRITAVGRVLRKAKLDELPQLVNVLRGDMSLVGPRPEDPRYVALYSQEQRKVLSVRPGITGLASVHFRNEEDLLDTADPDETYRATVMPRKLALELRYVERRSLVLDLAILWRTAVAVFKS